MDNLLAPGHHMETAITVPDSVTHHEHIFPQGVGHPALTQAQFALQHAILTQDPNSRGGKQDYIIVRANKFLKWLKENDND